MNSRERLLRDRILDFAEGDLTTVTPSLRVQAFERGRCVVDLQMGKKYTYYDLASLTKIFFTTFAWMRLAESHPKILQQPIGRWNPRLKASKVTPFQLLTHTAGLPWWKPFYKTLKGPLRHDLRWAQLEKKLARISPEHRSKAIYSDVDFLFLGEVLRKVTGQGLLENWEILKSETHLGRLHFNVNNKPTYARKLYAPTENCPWRKKVLQGEVHDDNSWALGGVAPQAGLFGRIEDVSELGLRLRRLYRGGRDPLFQSGTLKRFVRRQTPRSLGDWGLGFMLPTRGSASCSSSFSLTSFGHTGFTGTSLWYDPRQDRLVVILSNRVHPTRKNRRFVELRPCIHAWLT